MNSNFMKNRFYNVTVTDSEYGTITRMQQAFDRKELIVYMRENFCIREDKMKIEYLFRNSTPAILVRINDQILEKTVLSAIFDFKEKSSLHEGFIDFDNAAIVNNRLGVIVGFAADDEKAHQWLCMQKNQDELTIYSI